LPSLIFAILLNAYGLSAGASSCSSEKVAEVLSPADSSSPVVMIDCSLALKGSNVVTKRMIFEGTAASGITLDCNSAMIDGGEGRPNHGRDMIEVRSRRSPDSSTGGWRWDRPEDITIRNCRITGSVRIRGMAENGQGAHLRDSSRQSGHIERARTNAPTRITIDNTEITATGRIPLYFSPGVTHSSLINSRIKGISSSVAVYFDAESSGNMLRSNTFMADTGREIIALDGSSGNTIIGNSFHILNKGGIFLYRNCGEGGTIRHSPPERNIISGNQFFYGESSGDHPAVFIGSRNGRRLYCGADSGHPYGSSISDLDHASYNTITGNRFHNRTGSGLIRNGNEAVNTDNNTDDNLSIENAGR